MSYTPTEWKTGDVVTAEKLNKLENGIISGTVYMPINYDAETEQYSIEASYNDLMSMIENGQSVFGIMDTDNAPEGTVMKELFLIAGYASMPASDLYAVVFMSVPRFGIELEFGATDPDTPMVMARPDEPITPNQS